MDSVKKHTTPTQTRRGLLVPVLLTALAIIAAWAFFLAPKTLERAEKSANQKAFSGISGRVQSIMSIFKDEGSGAPSAQTDLEALGARVFGDSAQR